MNLQCPSCQRLLTVPEQFAGQMMKCPMCGGTFSVPAQGAAGDSLPPLPGGPLVSPPASTTPPPPSPATPPPATPTVSPTIPLAPPASAGLPPLAPSLPASIPTVSPSSPTPAGATGSAGTVPTPAPSAGGYANNCALYFRPDVMRWFAPVCVVLIFLLQFFPWVGIYPGGVETISQGAWGAAFGGFAEDVDMVPPKGIPDDDKPAASVLLIFYVLLFLPTLALTIAAFLIELGVISIAALPPQIQPLLKWRWAAVAGLNLLVFLLLALQMVLGFSLESKVATRAAAETKIAEVKGTKELKQARAMYGTMVAAASRTTYLWLAFLLHLIAIVGAWTTFCLHDRPNRPIPRLELSW